MGTGTDKDRVWSGARGLVRAQDVVWILLFAALAIFGTHRDAEPISFLAGLAVFQVAEPRIRYFASPQGGAVSFVIKLLLCYFLIGLTDGIASSYYWILLLPVISAATSLGLVGTLVATAVACGAYFSFLLRLGPGDVIEPDQVRELVLRAINLPVVGFLTNRLAQSSRAAAREYQAVAEQLAEANVNLQAAEAAVRRSERLAALGQMSAGLAHELRNPMGTMRNSAELLMKNVDPTNEVALEMATFIVSEVDRSNSLITRFLDFARPLKLKREMTDLTQVIDRAVQQMGGHKPPFEVAIYKNYSPDIRPFPMDGELMELVIYNLILNAVQASPPRGTVTVKTRQIDNMVELAVIDSGSGIDPKHLENIFNPFFTTKPTGVGLGLAIVSKIVDEHGGKISVDSEPGSGSVFRVYLPMEEREG